MLFKWFIIAAIIGFILGVVLLHSAQAAIVIAILFGAGAVAVRKWIFRTFWG